MRFPSATAITAPSADFRGDARGPGHVAAIGARVRPTAGDGRSRPRTSSQFGPAARSTLSGTFRSSAVVIASRTSVGQRGDLRVGGLEDQLVVDLEEHPGLRALARGCGRSTASMARLIRSAAEPWITVLTAVRSARLRIAAGRVLDPVDRPAAAEDRLDPPASPAPISSVRVMNASTPAYSLEIGVDERGGLRLR